MDTATLRMAFAFAAQSQDADASERPRLHSYSCGAAAVLLDACAATASSESEVRRIASLSRSYHKEERRAWNACKGGVSESLESYLEPAVASLGAPSIYKTMESIGFSTSCGYLLLPSLYVPSRVWQQSGVRLPGVGLKEDAFQLLIAGLSRLCGVLTEGCHPSAETFEREIGIAAAALVQVRDVLAPLLRVSESANAIAVPAAAATASASVEPGTAASASTPLHIASERPAPPEAAVAAQNQQLQQVPLAPHNNASALHSDQPSASSTSYKPPSSLSSVFSAAASRWRGKSAVVTPAQRTPPADSRTFAVADSASAAATAAVASPSSSSSKAVHPVDDQKQRSSTAVVSPAAARSLPPPVSITEEDASPVDDSVSVSADGEGVDIIADAAERAVAFDGVAAARRTSSDGSISDDEEEQEEGAIDDNGNGGTAAYDRDDGDDGEQSNTVNSANTTPFSPKRGVPPADSAAARGNNYTHDDDGATPATSALRGLGTVAVASSLFKRAMKGIGKQVTRTAAYAAVALSLAPTSFVVLSAHQLSEYAAAIRDMGRLAGVMGSWHTAVHIGDALWRSRARSAEVEVGAPTASDRGVIAVLFGGVVESRVSDDGTRCDWEEHASYLWSLKQVQVSWESIQCTLADYVLPVVLEDVRLLLLRHVHKHSDALRRAAGS